MYTTEEHIAPICERHGIPLNKDVPDRDLDSKRLFMAVTAEANTTYGLDFTVYVHGARLCWFTIQEIDWGNADEDYTAEYKLTIDKKNIDKMTPEVSPYLADMVRRGIESNEFLDGVFWIDALHAVTGELVKWRKTKYVVKACQRAFRRRYYTPLCSDPTRPTARARLLREFAALSAGH
jgi:alpha-L-fucosidase